MKNKFILGAVAGMSSLLLAVPVVMQVASAETAGTSSSAAPAQFQRQVPTQACLQAEVALQDAQLANFDAESAKRKQELQSRRDALAAVAAITDDTQRAGALKKMRQDEKSSMSSSQPSVPDNIKTAMDAVKTACGNTMMRGGMMGGQGMGGMMGGRQEVKQGMRMMKQGMRKMETHGRFGGKGQSSSSSSNSSNQ